MYVCFYTIFNLAKHNVRSTMYIFFTTLIEYLTMKMAKVIKILIGSISLVFLSFIRIIYDIYKSDLC